MASEESQKCILDHSGFNDNCLNKWVLKTTSLGFLGFEDEGPPQLLVSIQGESEDEIRVRFL